MSDKTSSSSASGGIGFGGLLAIVFITLKLTHVIDWSWLWVLSPLWIPIALVIAVLLLYVLGLGIAGLIRWLRYRKPRKSRLDRIHSTFWNERL